MIELSGVRYHSNGRGEAVIELGGVATGATVATK